MKRGMCEGTEGNEETSREWGDGKIGRKRGEVKAGEEGRDERGERRREREKGDVEMERWREGSENQAETEGREREGSGEMRAERGVFGNLTLFGKSKTRVDQMSYQQLLGYLIRAVPIDSRPNSAKSYRKIP